MSAQADRPGPRPARTMRSDRVPEAAAIPIAVGSGSRGAWGRLSRALTSEAPGRLPLPFPPLVLGLAMFAGYVFVSLASSDIARDNLASIPVIVAAALLPAGAALAIGGATIAFALWPYITEPGLLGLEAYHLVEIAALVVVALVLRAALARRVSVETIQAERDARNAERMQTVLGIAERMTRTFDRNEIFGTIVAELNRAMHTDVTTIRILRGDDLVVAAWAGIPDETAARLPVFRRDEGLFAHLMRTGRGWVRDDARTELADVDGHERYEGILEFSSDIVVPLVHHAAVIGALAAGTIGPRHWTVEDVAFMTAVATHASIAIHNAEMFERTEGRAAQLAVLQAASARMSRQNTVESVGRAIVEEMRRILDYHNARVYLLEPPDDLEPIAFEGTVGEYEKVDLALLRTKLGVGFTGWVGLHGEPLLIDDANADPRGSTIPGTDDVDESMLVVPMRYDERVIGVITLSKLGLNQFEDDDLRLLTILADQAATALESARLLGHSRQLAAELRRLLDMSGELAHSLDPRQVADIIARHLAQAMGTDACAVSYWDQAGGRILTMGYHPAAGLEGLQPWYELAGYPETRRVLVEQVTSIVDVDDAAADPAEVALMRQEGNLTLVMLPLVANGATIGLVELLASTRLTFDSVHLEFARTMANEAAMALENARLYEAARNLADRDQLTGFYNHRYLHERLGEEIIRAQRSRSPISVLMIDLDDFKLVNDTFGHLFGDRVLTWVAELMRSTMRGSDIPARYGGDEFAVILPDTDNPAAHRAADRILEACRDHSFQSEARGPLPIGLSIGVATFPQDGRAGQELVAAADRALYRVKNARGRGVETADEPDEALKPDAVATPRLRVIGRDGRAAADLPAR